MHKAKLLLPLSHTATQPHGQNKQAQAEAENEGKTSKRSTKKYSKKKETAESASCTWSAAAAAEADTKNAHRMPRPMHSAPLACCLPLPLCLPSSPAAFHLLSLPATKNFKSISATAFGHYEKKICRKTLNEETKKQLQKTS